MHSDLPILRGNTPLVIAHRGASLTESENTIRAFERAVADGADMLEFDVRRTRDGVLVIHHDPDIAGERLTDVSYERAAGLFRDRGLELATVAGTLERFRGRVRFDVELKEPGYEDEVIEAIACVPAGDVVVTSFEDEVVRIVGERCPEVATGLLLGVAEPDSPIRTRVSEVFPRARLDRTGADIVFAHTNLIDAPIFFGRRSTVPVVVWTVNDPPRIQKMLEDPRIAGIITDDPALAVSLRRNRDENS